MLLKGCPEGRYGVHCIGNCSGHCTDRTTCNYVTGQCDGGCSTGLSGYLCDKGNLKMLIFSKKIGVVHVLNAMTYGICIKILQYVYVFVIDE